jgi:hypothetical protein
MLAFFLKPETTQGQQRAGGGQKTKQGINYHINITLASSSLLVDHFQHFPATTWEPKVQRL